MDVFTCPPKALEASRDDPSAPNPESSHRHVSLLSEYESLLTTSLSGALQSLEVILEEHAEISDMSSPAWPSAGKYERMSEDDYLALVSHSSEATNRTAAAILQIIGLSGTELAAGLSWDRVSDEVKAFLVHRFARESVLGFVSKLKRECRCFSSPGGGGGGGEGLADCKCGQKVEVNLSGGDRGVAKCRGGSKCRPPPDVKRSVQKLLYATECLVDNMITLQEEGEEVEEGQRCLYHKIGRDISAGRHNADVKWLGDFIFYHLKPMEEHAVHMRAEIDAEVDGFVRSLLRWLEQQAQEHAGKSDAASAALVEIKKVEADLLELNKCSLVKSSDRPRPSAGEGEEEENKSRPTSEESPIAVEASAPEMYEASTCDEATALIDRELEELCCSLVGALVDKILEELMVVVSCDVVRGICTTLKEMLFAEVANADVDVRTSGQQVKGIVKAAYRDLLAKKPGPPFSPLALLSEDPEVFAAVVEALKKHLLPSRSRGGAARFFGSLCKPVTFCLRCND